jgi:FAD/FMN-containing dehydrogenase
VRGAWGHLHQHGTGSLYLNFSGDETATAGVESAFGKGNLQRLEEIKAAYDPDNFFRLNNNITPASSSSRDPVATA